MSKVILKAEDLDGYLNAADKDFLAQMDNLYKQIMKTFSLIASGLPERRRSGEDELISLYNEMGQVMQEICRHAPNVHVYTFLSPQESHPEVSRLIAKLRDIRTENQ